MLVSVIDWTGWAKGIMPRTVKHRRGWMHKYRLWSRRIRANLRRGAAAGRRAALGGNASNARREAWAAHKAAKRKRRKAETLLGRIAGLPRSWRPYVTGWVVMHPAAETKARRRPIRRRGDKKANRLAKQLADFRQVQANRVMRGRLSNPTALR